MFKSIDNTAQNEREERVCSFYASDYHFEMISLPYIQKEIKDKNKIIILTENNLEETIKTVLSRTNLKEEDKKKIIEIGWDENAHKKLENINDGENQTVFIKGSKKYIEEMENKIGERNSNIKMVHCYPIQEVTEEVNEIVKNYDAILNTIGKIDM